MKPITNIFRRYLELYTRKDSPVNQLIDVMGRMLEKTDPYIMERKLNYRPDKKSCGTCGSEKHSTKTHEKAVSLDTYSSLGNTILIESL